MPSRGSTAVAEIAIPPERIARELLRNALPGYCGECEICISLPPEALNGIELIVTPRRKVCSTFSGKTRSASAWSETRRQTVRSDTLF